MKPLNYRPEIDGLRAIAVLSVLLYHAGFQLFSGGYVGVDIFFVISGFLITSILVKAAEKPSSFFANFYESRIRRLFPALFFYYLRVLCFLYIFCHLIIYLNLDKAYLLPVYLWLISYFSGKMDILILHLNLNHFCICGA